MGYLSTLSGSQDLQKLSVEQLSEVASEIRSAIIGQVSSSGGHLAPNLGVVELTLALHYVFDFSFDRLLFDVGHQCYPHKLITGRSDRLSGLRTSAGMSGFPEPLESPYDLFRVGHAGTGVSTAVGMARGDQLSGEGFNPHDNPGGRRVVTMVGDASIVNGVSMEGLNNAGTLKRQLLVILNDNGMSISKPQGALAAYFDRVRVSHTYSDLKKAGRSLLQGLPGGSMIREAYHRAGEMTKALVSEDSWFDKFGLLTVGPIDGHDLPTLIEFLAEARDIDRPMVLHVKTVKGKGLEYAEKDATTFHSPAAHRYDPDSCRVELKSSGRSFTKAFADAMCDVMRRDDKAVACTAAMPGGTGIDKVIAEFPDRSWDVGICESHGMDMMAGLAKTGFRPFFAVYSTFLQRAFDQAFQEVSLQGLPVRLCLDRAGLVGGDGSVHHGFCDVAILRTLPGAALLAPIDEPSLREALEFMRTYDEGLSAVRYPRDAVSDRFLADDCPAFELGKARLLTPELQADERPDAAVLAFGVPAIDAMKALDMLGDEYRVAVWDARFAKPVDADMLRATIGRGIPVITVEDHGVTGGFGAGVLETASELGLDASKVTRLGLPDDWIHQDSRADQLRLARIDADGIAAAIRASVARCEVDSPSSRGAVEGTHATPAH
ncbi:MAG: 1-deoxy-D-xylulose-5-phosphate synthase [Planctomycetota bacterium]